MRVLHVTAAFPSANNPQSGVFIHSQIESQRERGIEIDVCVLRGKGLWKYVSGIYQIRKALHKNSYDLVHAHYMYTGWTARLATSLPLVVTYLGTDMFGKCNADGKYKPLSRLFCRFGSQFLSRVVSHNIAQSKQMVGYLVTKSSVVSYGVNLNVFSQKPYLRHQLDLDESKFYVLFAGSKTNAIKRYNLALSSVEIARRQYPSIEIITIEKQTQEQVARYLNVVNCLVLTSAHEGSPNIVKESLACNLPVISVDVGDVRERLEGVDNCHIVDANPNSIAEGILAVYHSGGRASNGRDKIAELSMPNVAEEMNNLYNDILKIPQ
jgi:glycosyltransferase involved in cell wall biosynthesis